MDTDIPFFCFCRNYFFHLLGVHLYENYLICEFKSAKIKNKHKTKHNICRGRTVTAGIVKLMINGLTYKCPTYEYKATTVRRILFRHIDDRYIVTFYLITA